MAPDPQTPKLGSDRSEASADAKAAGGSASSVPRTTGWLLGAGTLYFFVCQFVPWFPSARSSVIEESYFQALHEAYKAHLQFGRDIVFTYGPWGFLHGGNDPATHWISVAAWLVLALVFWWAAWRAACGCLGNRPVAWLWVFLFGAVMAGTQFFNVDPRFAGFILLLLVLHFFAEEGRFTVAQGTVAVSLGLISLIKFSVLIEGGFALAVIALDTVWRQRRVPWGVPLFCASLLFFWRLAGQHWDCLLPYLRNSWRVAAGFADSMELASPTDGRDVAFFLVGAVLVVALTAYACWRQHRWFGILPLTGMAFVVFSAFKYGYVRHDIHEVAAVAQLLLAALAANAIASKWVREKGLPLVATVLPALAAFCPYLGNLQSYGPGGLPGAMAGTFGIRRLFAPWQVVSGYKSMVREQDDYYAGARSFFPLPAIHGTVDLYPWQQLAVFAHGLAYDPRPIFQSYSAYTPELAAMNADFLRSKRAPENVLFSIAPIDERYPAEDDGPSWLELLTRYDPAGTVVFAKSFDSLILTRSETPRRWQKDLLQDTVAAFGSPIKVPSAKDGPMWMEMEIDRTLTGKVVSELYKPPELAMQVTFADGRTHVFRLIPGMARAGFLISPFIGDAKSFAKLMGQHDPGVLAGPEVPSIAIILANGGGPGFCYKDTIKLRFYRLTFSEAPVAAR